MSDVCTRRRFLAKAATASVGGVVLTGVAGAARTAPNRASQRDEDSEVFVFSRLQFRTINQTQDQWDCGIDKEEDLLEFLRKNTSVRVSQKSFYERSISIEDLRNVYARPGNDSVVYTRPFLFMTGSGKFEFNAPESATLAEYLRRGGFWYIDDCISSPRHTSDFYRTFLREVRNIWPDQEMRPVPHDHEIYHCVYDAPEGAPWVQGEHVPDMGLFMKDRLAVFLTGVDLHCGWRWEWTSRSEHKDKTICRKMGVNIIVYALTH